MSDKHPVKAIRCVGGRLCLDFVNSAHRRPMGPGDEYLHTLDDFLAWAALTGMLTGNTSRTLREKAGNHATRLLAEVIELRELLHRVFRPIAEGTRPGEADLKTFETHVRAARARQRLRFTDGRAHWDSARPDQPDITLADPILADADALLTGDQLDRVKQCEPGEGCGWLFLDTTKNRSRRWCSMETCGSAAKARAWYRRKRDTAT